MTHKLPEGYRIAVDGKGRFIPQYCTKQGWFGRDVVWHDLLSWYNVGYQDANTFSTKEEACQAVLDYLERERARAEEIRLLSLRCDAGPC